MGAKDGEGTVPFCCIPEHSVCIAEQVAELGYPV